MLVAATVPCLFQMAEIDDEPYCSPGDRAEAMIDALGATAPIFTRVGDDRLCQRLFVIPSCGQTPLGRTDLPHRVAGAALGDRERRYRILHKRPTTGGAWKFPSAASFRISLSRVSSDTALRRRAFSRSSSFSRLA